MRGKMWKKILLSILITVNVGILVMVLESVSSEDKPDRFEYKSEFRAVPIPDSAWFAGELMPLGRFDVKESLDRELLSNAYFHSQTIRYIKMAPRFFAIIEPILKQRGIPDDFKYLAVAESGFDPRAVSPSNAVGLWQFMKSTAQEYGLTVNDEIDERYHIEKSTFAACDYLLNSYKKYGNWTMVAASYNAGMNGVDRQIERQNTDSYYDLLMVEETARYLYRIVALKLILENPEKYNFYISKEEKYPIIKTRLVEISQSVDDFSEFAQKQGINYKLLKDFNPWLRETYLYNPGGKKYIVKIPEIH